jgi:hypothetical protein
MFERFQMQYLYLRKVWKTNTDLLNMNRPKPTNRTVTIEVTNVSQEFIDLIWTTYQKQLPMPMLTPPDRENIRLDFPEMPNALAGPLAEMLILATTLAAIMHYQKENN